MSENIKLPESLEPTRVEGRKYPIAGYAPGNYMCNCCDCHKIFMGDKRAVQCESCAEKSVESIPSTLSPEIGEGGEVPADVMKWIEAQTPGYKGLISDTYFKEGAIAMYYKMQQEIAQLKKSLKAERAELESLEEAYNEELCALKTSLEEVKKTKK